MYLTPHANPILNVYSGISFAADLQAGMVPSRYNGSPTATFTRATTKPDCEDFEGRKFTALSGEWVSKGARRVRNLVTRSEDFGHSSWAALSAAATASGQTITFPGSGNDWRAFQYSVTSGRTYVFTAKIRSGTKTGSIVVRDLEAGDFSSKVVSLSADGAIISITGTAGSTSTRSFGFDNRSAQGGDSVAGTIVVEWAQLEDVTGQSVQVFGGYVSVGVLSAPYHGAGVDGVKWFTTHNGNTVSSNVVTEATGPAISSANSKFAVLGGANGDTLSTPDKSGLPSGTDIIDVDLIGALDDWTPGASKSLITQYVSANIGWSLYLTSGGNIVFVWSADGSSTVANLTSSVVLPATDRARLGLRCKFNPANGGQSTADFSTSVDGGATWTALGTQRTNAGNSSVYNSTQKVEVFGDSNGSNAARGRAYRMRLYNGDRDAGGTLVLDCNPNDFSSGTEWDSSTTGETWTINGNARIFGGSGSSSIAAPWDSGGNKGLSLNNAFTERALHNDDFSNAVWVSGGGGIAVTPNTAVSPDGTTTADTLTASGANGTLIQDMGTVASAAKTIYFDFMRKTGTGNIDITMDGGSTWTTVTIYSGFWTRVTKAQTLADEDFGIRIVTSGDEIYARRASCRTGLSVGGAPQTTTAAVAVNEDVLTFTATGNVASIGTVYCEATCDAVANSTGAHLFQIDDGTNNNRFYAVYISSQISTAVITGGVQQASITGGSVANGVVDKYSARCFTNDVRVVVDGAAVGSQDTSATMPAVTTIRIGGGFSAGFAAEGTVRNFQVFARPQSDSQQIARTS